MKPIMSKAWMMVFAQLVLVFLLLACFLAGTGTAGGKPTAITKAATYVSYCTARLNGIVNPNGILTLHYWEYGTTTAYGKKTSSWSVGSGTSNADVYADVGNVPPKVGSLTPNTTYHFRLVAENSAGKAYGADMTFTTQAPPPSVKTGPPTNITTNSARLTGTVNPNGVKTMCQFQYGTTTDYKTGIGTSPAGNGTSQINVYVDLNKLHVDTIYHYQLKCESSSGFSLGSDMAFKTKSSNLLQKK
jgi:hypothetical protein